MADLNRIEIEQLTVESFRPYGWVLGKPMHLDGSVPGFSNMETDFWEEHLFDAGAVGETQILWVNYRNQTRVVNRLESHRICQQAIVPLTGEIIQVVAMSPSEGLRAFRVGVGQGICMRAGCWHTTRVAVPEVQCMMLTRRSTTIDLISHLTAGSPLVESEIALVERRYSLT